MAEQLNFFRSGAFLKKKRLTMQTPVIKMPEQPDYDLKRLRNKCFAYIKEKYPRPVECEEYSDYLEMLEEETELELAYRLHEIANKIEAKIYEPQRKIIQEVYRK